MHLVRGALILRGKYFTCCGAKCQASNRLTFRGGLRAVEPLPVLINGNQIILEKNSWLNTANDEHLINASFTFSDKISQKAFEKSYEYLSERVGKGVASAVSELLFTPVTKNGKIHMSLYNLISFVPFYFSFPSLTFAILASYTEKYSSGNVSPKLYLSLAKAFSVPA